MKALPLVFCCSLLLLSTAPPDWGFFGHRRINRLAAFTLPPEMVVFYKKHLEYITEHAVDPDKRRYATRHEAPRHFIDIDHWGEYPFPELPRQWSDALLRHSLLCIIDGGDTIRIFDSSSFAGIHDTLRFSPAADPQWLAGGLRIEAYRQFFRRQVLPQYYEDQWLLSRDSLQALLGVSLPPGQPQVVDQFSEYGILPYHLLQMQNALSEAFRQKSVARILRLSAEIGHYIGDAHVPLHTTENYNGQLTGQDGIHAFWESRLPELFADERYNLFVGKAQYIEQPREYFWEIVLASHRLVADVLGIEMALRQSFPPDKQFCFEERLGVTVRTQCRDFAEAYQKQLGGQVEKRMREAILAIGSSWYTAWVDAGQPDLRALMKGGPDPKESQEMRELEAQMKKGKAKGREHE